MVPTDHRTNTPLQRRNSQTITARRWPVLVGLDWISGSLPPLRERSRDREPLAERYFNVDPTSETLDQR